MKEYYFPAEDKKHEGTWLNWPHHYTYGRKFRKKIEEIWIEITYVLYTGENIHIVAYDEIEKKRISDLLEKKEIDISKIDFMVVKTDDVWVRDTGPIFALDEENKLTIINFKFDGWGNKAPYKNDNEIPKFIANKKNIPIINIPNLVLEGGSIELDGNKSAMLTKSSIISKNRNSNLSVMEVEKCLSRFFGITNFIWLEGVIDEDITDGHIDGLARFYDNKTILTVSKNDFFDMYENILASDYDILLNAKNSEGENYKIIELPLTKENVKNLNYKGNYLNYYVGNEVVLVPIYNDKNDDIAINILKDLYQNRKIIPVNVTDLYKYGGMIHCITQQQPEVT